MHRGIHRVLASKILGAPALITLAVLATDESAFAQDCGSWARPVLCEAELFVTDADGDSDRVSARSRYRIAPRAQLDLELVGRDQRGRRFPEDRMMLRYDEAGCRGVLNVEDRGRRGIRLTARAVGDRCRLDVWVPGNLNFEWEIEVEVDAGARTGYSRANSEHVVRALFRAILGRDPERDAIRSAVAEVQRGNLEALVNAMVRSPEFNQSRAGTEPEELLDRVYQGLFDRTADSRGVREYLDRVRSRRYSEVVLSLIRSPEFEQRLPD